MYRITCQTATAGTAPANVTPGIYYYDGVKWQRVINQQPDATVEFNTANPNSGSPTFTPNTPASKDYVYVSSVDNSQWTYNGSAYVTYTPPASTPWMRSGGTIDAGSNKADPIYRTGKVGIGPTTPNAKLDIRTNPTSTTDPGDGYLGIGTTSTAANTAGAGALRYNISTGGVLEYSNGSIWQALAATKKVAVYTEVHTNAGSTGTYAVGSALNDFGTSTADNVKAVYGSSYGFFDGSGTGSSSDRWVAPFTGKFRVTTNVYFNHNASYGNPRLYAYLNDATICNILSVNTGGQDLATCTSAIISMNQGDYINWKFQNASQIWRGLYHTFFRIESVE
ncbi:MAG: hypothetical protein FJ347_07420 [Sphingomonadales bacterium]|nr:hypothetical protein [Sphingomonadales bacterium]